MRVVGAVLVGLSTGAITLCVPAIIAGGRSGAEAFLVAFGMVSSLGVVAGLLANPLIGKCIEVWGVGCVMSIAVIPAVLGMLALLPVRRELFSGPPPIRGRTFPPRLREPFVVGVLFFVPFYYLYWLYRAHGEVAAVAPSRSLLSPRGALLGTIFVPFLNSVALASLIEALNRQHLGSGQPRLHSPVALFLWGLFFPPVAGAMVQSGINKTVGAKQVSPT
jgi:hypothetical protein